MKSQMIATVAGGISLTLLQMISGMVLAPISSALPESPADTLGWLVLSNLLVAGVLASLAGIVLGHGGAFTPTFGLSALDGSNGFRIRGENFGDHAGRAVRIARIVGMTRGAASCRTIVVRIPSCRFITARSGSSRPASPRRCRRPPPRVRWS